MESEVHARGDTVECQGPPRSTRSRLPFNIGIRRHSATTPIYMGAGLLPRGHGYSVAIARCYWAERDPWMESKSP